MAPKKTVTAAQVQSGTQLNAGDSVGGIVVPKLGATAAPVVAATTPKATPTAPTAPSVMGSAIGSALNEASATTPVPVQTPKGPQVTAPAVPQEADLTAAQRAAQETPATPVSTSKEAAANINQQAFDQLNKVGTKLEDIKTPEKQVLPGDITPGLAGLYSGTNVQPNAAFNPLMGGQMNPQVPGLAQKPTVAQAEQNKLAGDTQTAADRAFSVNPNLDQFSFRKAAGWEKLTEEQRKNVDAAWNAYRQKQVATMPQTQADYFSAFVKGQTPRIESQDGIRAKSRFDLISPYRGASSDSIYSGMVRGDIHPNTPAWTDLVTANGGETAAMVEAKQKWNNKMIADSANRTAGNPSSSVSVEKVSDTVSSAMSDEKKGAFSEYIAQNKDIESSMKELNSTNTKIKELELQKQLIYDDLKEQYPNVPASILSGMAAEASKPLNLELMALQNTASEKSAMLQYYTNIANKDFEQEQQIASEARQFQKQIQLFNLQTATQKQQQAEQFAQQEKMTKMGYAQSDAQQKLQFAQQERMAKLQSALAQQGFETFKSENGDLYKIDKATGTPSIIMTAKPAEQTAPTGEIEQMEIGGRPVALTSPAASALQTAFDAAGGFQVNQSFRTQEVQNQLYGKGRSVEDLKKAGFSEADATKYAKPTEKQVTWTLSSKHQQGTAIDIDAKDIEKAKPFLNAAGFYQNPDLVKIGDIGHFEYKPEGIKSTEQQAYDDEILAKRMAFAISGKNATDKEFEAQKKIIELGRKLGKTDIQMLNEQAGFDISKENEKFGLQAIDALSNAWLTPSKIDQGMSLSKNINSWNLKGAAANIESAVFNKPEAKAIKLAEKDADFRSVYEKAQKLSDQLEKVKDKIGPVSGRVANINSAFYWDSDLQEAKSRLTEFVASLRKNYAGSAVTPTELTALQDYIDGKNTEPLKNIFAKVNTILDLSATDYNTMRESVGIPRIDSSTINDRSSLYFKRENTKENALNDLNSL